MNETDFSTLSGFIKRKSGILVGDNKGYLVESRLSGLATRFGYSGVDDLARNIERANPEVADAVVDAMTTNESFFFRDTTPFTLFEEVMLPALVAARRTSGRIRIWCAAASTGQEPYSLAMILLANKAKWQGLNVEILGTDLSDISLERARQGKYSQFEVQRGLPIQMLVDHFTQEGTNWLISDEIKSMVRWSKLNLLDPLTQVGPVDIIFCRNVLIYFDVPTKAKVLESLSRLLPADGYLVLGAAETMIGVSDLFERADGKRGLYTPAGSELSKAAGAA